MHKKKIKVGGFKVSACVVGNGILQVRIENARGGRVTMIDYPGSGCDRKSETSFYSINPVIVDYERQGSRSPRWRGEDDRVNPEPLREAGKDPGFRSWWMKLYDGETPEEAAAEIERKRAKESVRGGAHEQR